jgi:hypothetical protein
VTGEGVATVLADRVRAAPRGAGQIDRERTGD